MEAGPSQEGPGESGAPPPPPRSAWAWARGGGGVAGSAVLGVPPHPRWLPHTCVGRVSALGADVGLQGPLPGRGGGRSRPPAAPPPSPPPRAAGLGRREGSPAQRADPAPPRPGVPGSAGLPEFRATCGAQGRGGCRCRGPGGPDIWPWAVSEGHRWAARPLRRVLVLGMGRRTLGEEIGSSQVWNEGGRLGRPRGGSWGGNIPGG